MLHFLNIETNLVIIVFNFGDNRLLVVLIQRHVFIEVDVLGTNVVRLDRRIMIQVFDTAHPHVLCEVVFIAIRLAIAIVEYHEFVCIMACSRFSRFYGISL